MVLLKPEVLIQCIRGVLHKRQVIKIKGRERRGINQEALSSVYEEEAPMVLSSFYHSGNRHYVCCVEMGGNVFVIGKKTDKGEEGEGVGIGPLLPLREIERKVELGEKKEGQISIEDLCYVIGLPRSTGKNLINWKTSKPKDEDRDQNVKNVKRHLKTVKCLEEAFSAFFPMPWPKQAESECVEYRAMVWENKIENLSALRFSIDCLTDAMLLGVPTTKQSLSRLEWGQLIVCYDFLSLLYFYSDKSDEIPEDDIQKYERLTELLLESLKDFDAAPWTEYLRFWVQSRFYGVLWNQTPPEERCSQTTRERFEKIGYLEAAVKHLEKCEKDKDSAHNALAYVSRMNMKEHFPDLIERLKIAYNGKLPDLDNDKEFDGDFDHVRAWLKDQKLRRK